MAEGDNLRSGGQLLVDALLTNGADMAFCVPGESYLTVLDALHDAPGIDLLTCRQEGGAAMMADAYGKMTGRPGICFVTRGPGATNASSGVHIAFQDSTPMILLVGQIGRAMRDREAFQEIDYRRMFGQMAKWVAEIDSAERVPEYISRAYHTCMAGRPGPVVLALPEDMQDDRAPSIHLNTAHRIQSAPSTDDIADLRERLSQADRPLVILGGNFWTDTGIKNIRLFVEANHLPVTCAFRYQHLFNNDNPNYAGDVGIGINPSLSERVKSSDLLITVGARLGEMTTSGYNLLDIPMPKQALVHVYPGPEELGRVYWPELAINSSMDAFAKACAGMMPVKAPWAEETKAANADYIAWSQPTKVPGDVNVGEIMHILRDIMPNDGVVTNGAGNFAAFVNRFFRYRDFQTQLAPTSGSMGYGVPAGIAAKRIHPNRIVVTVAGDGDFMMTGQELATAKSHGINVIIIIVNNGMYGTIRMHQEKHFPGRTIATELENPDFQLLAKAYGAHAELVTKTANFRAAFERARESNKPAIIELKVDPEAITPSATLTELRAASRVQTA